MSIREIGGEGEKRRGKEKERDKANDKNTNGDVKEGNRG